MSSKEGEERTGASLVDGAAKTQALSAGAQVRSLAGEPDAPTKSPTCWTQKRSYLPR